MKRLFTYGLLACVAAGVAANATAGWDKKTEELSLDAGALSKFEISAGAGDLVVKGSKTANSIEVTAKIRGRDLAKDDYELYLLKKGERAYLYAHFEKNHHDGGYIDLEVTFPSSIPLVVEDGSGDMIVRNVDADVSITDGSGDSNISAIAGNLKFHDGSGEAIVDSVSGDVTIKDGSGELLVKTISGNIDITDGSGDLRILTVGGDVMVKDSSGDLDIITVAGDVEVRDSSGDIYVDTAESFALHADGSGDVELRNVKRRDVSE